MSWSEGGFPKVVDRVPGPLCDRKRMCGITFSRADGRTVCCPGCGDGRANARFLRSNLNEPRLSAGPAYDAEPGKSDAEQRQRRRLGRQDQRASVIKFSAAEVGWIASQNRYCDGSQSRNWAHASVTFDRPKAPGFATASLSRPKPIFSSSPSIPPEPSKMRLSGSAPRAGSRADPHPFSYYLQLPVRLICINPGWRPQRRRRQRKRRNPSASSGRNLARLLP